MTHGSSEYRTALLSRIRASVCKSIVLLKFTVSFPATWITVPAVTILHADFWREWLSAHTGQLLTAVPIG